MKSYQCHKVVQAGEILGVDAERHNVFFDNGGGVSMWTSADLFARGAPGVTDYIVFYDGDYVSWSPKAVFEAGYTYMAPAAAPAVEPAPVPAVAAPEPAPAPVTQAAPAINVTVTPPPAVAPPAFVQGRAWVP
jgi:hypothetical protein